MKKLGKKFIIAIAIITMFGGSTIPVQAASTDSIVEKAVHIKTKFNFEEEVKSFSDLGIMFRAWEEFLAANPNSTELEQEAFLIRFVEEGGLRKTYGLFGIGDYIPGYNNLNEAERKLVLKHPIQAIKVFDCANKAQDATVEYYGSSNWQDNSDAFRHCAWNALMKKAIGSSAAEEWATAHEYDSSGIDKEMDLFNNKVGRSINVTNKSNSEIFEAVKEKVSNGSCRRIVKNKLVPTDSSGLLK